MKILVTGDRNWTDELKIFNTLMEIGFDYPVDGENSSFNHDITLIEGEARGADTLARIAAEKLDWTVIKVPAEWNKYGKAAGPIRNQAMLDLDPDLVVAFHSDLENSRGTKDMVERAKKKGVKVTHIS